MPLPDDDVPKIVTPEVRHDNPKMLTEEHNDEKLVITLYILTEPQLPDFYHPSENQKMVNYYLLQWVQAWKHMHNTSTLNK